MHRISSVTTKSSTLPAHITYLSTVKLGSIPPKVLYSSTAQLLIFHTYQAFNVCFTKIVSCWDLQIVSLFLHFNTWLYLYMLSLLHRQGLQLLLCTALLLLRYSYRKCIFERRCGLWFSGFILYYDISAVLSLCVLVLACHAIWYKSWYTPPSLES